MTVLVTGASGFVGSRLVDRLLAQGQDVIAFGRKPPVRPQVANLRTITAEFDAFHGWASVLPGVDTVHHLAWSSLPNTASANPAADARANVLGSLRLFDALREYPGVRLVFASSGGAVYGKVESLPIDEEHVTKPISAYGVSKLSVESYLRFYHASHGMRPIALRIANVYGAGQAYGRQFGAIVTFAASLIRDEEIKIFGDGSSIRDYVHVDDVVEAFLAAASSAPDIDYLNIGLGEGRSLNDIVAVIQRDIETEPRVRYLPARTFDVPASVLAIRRARRQIGWWPRIGFDEGLRRTVTAMRRDIIGR